MLIMSRGLYTGENFKQIIMEQTKENLKPCLQSWSNKLSIWWQLFLIKIYYAIIACMTYIFTFGKCWIIEKWLTFKN